MESRAGRFLAAAPHGFAVSICSGQAGCRVLSVRARRRFEDEIDGLRFLRADGYGLRIARAVEFLPGDDRVGAGREILQIERAVFAGDLEIWIREHTDVG